MCEAETQQLKRDGSIATRYRDECVDSLPTTTKGAGPPKEVINEANYIGKSEHEEYVTPATRPVSKVEVNNERHYMGRGHESVGHTTKETEALTKERRRRHGPTCQNQPSIAEPLMPIKPRDIHHDTPTRLDSLPRESAIDPKKDDESNPP